MSSKPLKLISYSKIKACNDVIGTISVSSDVPNFQILFRVSFYFNSIHFAFISLTSLQACNGVSCNFYKNLLPRLGDTTVVVV
jgi:hypothetical protein